MRFWRKAAGLLVLVVSIARSATGRGRSPPTKPFPLFPDHDETTWADLRAKLDDSVQTLLSSKSLEWDVDESSFAVQVTNAKETVWSRYHTATNTTTTAVTGDTVFRIASISKTFTVYALLLQDVRLDSVVTEYLPELAAATPQSATTTTVVNWSHVTVEMLASQLGGVARDTGGSCFVWRELMDRYDEGELRRRGFPPAAASQDSPGRCNLSTILDHATHAHAVFSAASQATYSNVAFSLLGAIVERSAGRPFADVVRDAILTPLSMRSTRMSAPVDLPSAVPTCPNDWSRELGADTPTAGLYSTASDLSLYVRSILGAQLLPAHRVRRWLAPRSWAHREATSAYGMPWEILRTTRLTRDGRPVDIVSKGGALRGFYSSLVMVPEFGIGFSILTAAESVKVMEDLRETFTRSVVDAMDDAFRALTRSRYSGVYLSDDRQSALELEVQDGLTVKRWISNGTDFLQTYALLQNKKAPWKAQLLPTGVVEESTPAGQVEYWRLDMVDESNVKDERIWADAVWTDVDDLQYAGRAVGEFGFVTGATGDVLAVVSTTLGTNLRRVTNARSLDLGWESKSEL